MSNYIDVDKFNREMYHEAFETDTDMQRWDSGCWIRYKLFENVLKAQPAADVVPKEKYDKLLRNATILAKAWDKVKNDLSDLWLEGHSPYTEVMEIINKHLKEVEE